MKGKGTGAHLHQTMLMLISAHSFSWAFSQHWRLCGLFARRTKGVGSVSDVTPVCFLRSPALFTSPARVKQQKTVSIFAAVDSLQASTQLSVPHRLCFGTCLHCSYHFCTTSYPLPPSYLFLPSSLLPLCPPFLSLLLSFPSS